ncbi:MAG TPA: NAD-dependent epimerase/dehydratase family protein [Terriglobales bacterium]|nr:NAD-dependent epimerase/dehydratase family protein [Terriglobales bacterium]
MTTARVLVVGASGYVGRQLAALGGFPNARWVGRRAGVPLPGYVAVPRYDESSLAPHVRGQDVVLHLAALTRGRREAAMREANVETTRRLAATLRRHNPDARVIFASSDLASHGLSPYGRSKREAEDLLLAAGLDAVVLRAPTICGMPVPALTSSMQALKAMAARGTVPAPNGGRFAMRPLWIEDLAAVLGRLADRKGRAEDRGLWSAFGRPVGYDALIRTFAAQAGRRARIVPVPASLLAAAGRLLAAVNPDTAFPLDFLEAIGREPAHPPDVFAHLGLAPREPEAYLPMI